MVHHTAQESNTFDKPRRLRYFDPVAGEPLFR
jgi:hypothetical protein